MTTLWLLLVGLSMWVPARALPGRTPTLTPRVAPVHAHPKAKPPATQPTLVTVDPAVFPLSPGYHLIKTMAHLDARAVPVTFGVFLPRAYFETNDPMPVVMALHTRGASGTDGRDRFINEELALLTTTTRQDFRTQGEYPKVRLDLHTQSRFICLMPQCPDGFNWETPPVGRILEAEVNEVLHAYQADADRVYVTGFSYGGSSTWTIALQVPQVFAAIAPVDARAIRNPTEDIKRIAGLPIYMAVGENDHDFVLASNRMRDALMTVPHSDFVYRTVPHGNHFCYPCVYEDPAFWDWMLSHRRPHTATAEAR